MTPDWQPSDVVIKRYGIFSAILLTASIVVHLLTFLPNPPPLSWSFPIHIALFVPFIAMLVALRRSPEKTRREVGGMLAWFRYTSRSNRRFFADLEQAISPAQKLLAVAIVVYVFLTAKLLSDNAGANEPESLVIRAFSAGWIVFTFLPTVFFLSVEPKLRAKANQRRKERERPGTSLTD